MLAETVTPLTVSSLPAGVGAAFDATSKMGYSDAQTAANRKLVLMHEIGHAIGLGTLATDDRSWRPARTSFRSSPAVICGVWVPWAPRPSA